MALIKTYCILLTLLECRWTNDVEKPLLKQTTFSLPFSNVNSQPRSYSETLWFILAWKDQQCSKYQPSFVTISHGLLF